MPLLEVLEVDSFRCLEGVHQVEVFRGDLEPGLKGVFGLDFVIEKYGVSARGARGKRGYNKDGRANGYKERALPSASG